MDSPRTNVTDLVRTLVNADRNLNMLRALRECGAWKANERVLRDVAEAFGASTTMGEARSALELLRREGLVQIEEVEGILVAELTEEGEDVILGRTVNEWVAAPGPVSRERSGRRGT